MSKLQYPYGVLSRLISSVGFLLRPIHLRFQTWFLLTPIQFCG